MSYNGYSSEHLAADQLKQHNDEPAMKKFKPSAAPKGTKLAPGYQDRTKLREDGYNEETSKEKKLKDLEKMFKEEKIDRATFEQLRDQMGIGGDLSTTHLVKGLDFKLLEKMRKGEDVENAPPRDKAEPNVDVDDELDNVLEKDVTALPSLNVKSAEEQGLAQPQVLSREEILRRLKESRRAQTTGPPPADHSLGAKFKKLPAAEKPGKKKFVETVNGRRREVLLLTNKDGSTKRKTRWIDPDRVTSNENATPLGMEVPAEFVAKQKALLEQETVEEGDEDIFVGVADYDPLQDLDSDSEGESNEIATMSNKAESGDTPVEVDSKPRNYFANKDESGEEKSKFSSIRDDPNLMAALKRAAALRQLEKEADRPAHEVDASSPEADQEHRHKAFLARLKQQDRQDAEDMDLGFGESRFGDDDDEDGPLYNCEDGDRKSRKRGSKKPKGDKHNVADVMSVLEGRRK
ncbi:hypothetical protein DV736_g1473, partial [Chaetothyriales sp. CBS 134916]